MQDPLSLTIGATVITEGIKFRYASRRGAQALTGTQAGELQREFQPCLADGEHAGGKPAEPGVLAAADAVFDAGVGAVAGLQVLDGSAFTWRVPSVMGDQGLRQTRSSQIRRHFLILDPHTGSP